MTPMGISVKNGTTVHGPSLCETCINAHIERGYRASEELVICAANYPVHRVLFVVRDCTSYVDKTKQNLQHMEDIAWLLSPRGPKRKAGFTPPNKREDDGEIELILDGKKVELDDQDQK
jgi:hypothetical protein